MTRLHARAGSPHLGAAALGVLDDLAVTEATGWAVGHALADAGIDLDLAPVADVNSCADNPVIGTRSFGADPTSAAAHTAAWATGLQAAGVAACVKHFPGHGDTHDDSHLGLPVVDVDLETLRSPRARAVRGRCAPGRGGGDDLAPRRDRAGPGAPGHAEPAGARPAA